MNTKVSKAIINPKDNLELSNYLHSVVREFIIINDIHDSNRGYCFIHAHEFIKWIEKRYPILYKKLIDLNLKTIDGLFQIDYPIELPLSLNDLKQNQYEKFMEENEDDYYVVEDDPCERSEMIWDWVNDNMTQEEIKSFYFIEHTWIEVGGLIIDFTWKQFRHAIDNKSNIKERYNYHEQNL